MAKRLICLIVSVLMVVSLLPMGAFAEEETTSNVATVYAADGTVVGSYSTLADAISAAVNGQTVKLLSSVEVSETLNIYKSITLDLGEYTITSSASGKAIYTTQTLKITATNGGIKATAGTAIVNQKGSGSGTLTIEGGTYESTASHAISNYNGIVIVNGGKITSSADTKDGICCYSEATVTVNGGTISGTRYGIYSLKSLTITGGTVSGTKAGVYVNGGTVTISGGTVKSDDAEGLKGTSDAEITITGGTFSGKTHAVNVSSDATVSGGTFTATGAKTDYAVAFYISGGEVTFSGGTFSGAYSTVWIKTDSDGVCTVADGYYVNTGSLTDYNRSEDALVRVVLKNGYYLVEEYKSDDTYTYPTSEGKVFAGWYTDDTCETVFKETSGAAYAKFVDDDVLSVKCVFTPNASGSSNAWRFVSSLDSVNYSASYFIVGGTTNAVSTYYSTYNVQSVSTTFKPSDFSDDSAYVTTYGFLDSSSTTTYTVRAGWTTADGTTVYGATYTFDASGCTSADVLTGTVS